MTLNHVQLGNWIRGRRIRAESWPTSLLSRSPNYRGDAALVALRAMIDQSLVVGRAVGLTVFAIACREAPKARRLLGFAALGAFRATLLLLLLTLEASVATCIWTLRATRVTAIFSARRPLFGLGLIAVVVEATLVLRLWWQVAGSTIRSGPTSYIYDLSGVLVRPFEGVERNPPVDGTAILSTATLTAIEVYLALSLALVLLVLIGRYLVARWQESDSPQLRAVRGW